MIDVVEARRLVYQEINRPDRYWPDKPEMIVLDEHTTETAYGWVFYWTSRPWYETDEFKYAIAGNGPILVSKEDGTLYPCGSAPPAEDRIRQAEEQLKTALLKRNK